MFTPTKEELEELGFYWDYKGTAYGNSNLRVKLWNYNPPIEEYKYFISDDEVYPKSLEDLKNLIRLLTP